MSTGRTFPACITINLVIYCVGGLYYWDGTLKPVQLLNDHISFSLSQLDNYHDNNFSFFKPSTLPWKNLSNINHSTGKEIPPISYSITFPLNSTKGYVLYDGLELYDNYTKNYPEYPRMKYNIEGDIWTSLQTSNDKRDKAETDVINTGNGVAYKKDSTALEEEYNTTDNTIADYKFTKYIWPDIYNPDPMIPIGLFHIGGSSSTLIENYVYRIGGYRNGYYNGGNMGGSYQRMGFVIKYDTIKLEGIYLNAGGPSPSSREAHTATYLSNKNLILIYGGFRVLDTSYNHVEDNYVIYNVTSNSYIEVDESLPYQHSKKRYGHYATLYNSNYLLLAFGMVEYNRSADIINMINITDPLKPVWIVNVDNSLTNNNTGLTNTTLTIISVISTVVGLIIMAVIIYYLKQRLQLEKEDPRKSSQHLNQLNFKENILKEEETLLKPYDSRLKDYNKLFDAQLDYLIKPNQIDTCKAHENQYGNEKIEMEDESTINNESMINQSSTLNIDSSPGTSSLSILLSKNRNMFKPSKF
ncbi:unnamed protein product [Cunninghamella blakesleeana]